MMFTRIVIRSGCLLIAALFLMACAETVSVNSTDSPLAAPTPSFFAEAAKPYRGLVLRGLSENTPPSRYVRDVLAPAFEQVTGIKVELEISDNPHIEKIIESGGGPYDYVYVEQDVIYGYLDKAVLVNLTQTLQENPRLRSPDFSPIDFTEFIDAFKDPSTGDLYGVPMEAFIKIYAYRKDLFEDPNIQAAFAAEYDYPLAPAVTFNQYRDNAAFFTQYGRQYDLELWGTAVQAAVGRTASFYEFFETIAPAFGVYNWGINPDNYKATVANGGGLDSARAKEALTFWTEMLQYAPPNATSSTWTEVVDAFASGQVAQAWLYGEYISELATDSSRSQVVNKVGVALPPTYPGVIEDATTGKGYVGYYDGAAFGLPINSKNKEAALLWLQYLGQPAIQPEWAIASGRIVHLSTFDDPLVQAQDEKLDGYYTLMKEQGQLFAGAPPFPFHASVRDVIMPFIDQAITGELTPEQALDQAAIAVDRELVRLGYGQ
jgi:multiple sugar transport system substrate-binding protein